jgi:hypothetical protein
LKISYGFWGGKQIKLDRLQIVRTDKVVGGSLACQWKGAPIDSRTLWVDRQIDTRPECRGAYTSSMYSTHLLRGADVGTPAAVKSSPMYISKELVMYMKRYVRRPALHWIQITNEHGGLLLGGTLEHMGEYGS